MSSAKLTLTSAEASNFLFGSGLLRYRTYGTPELSQTPDSWTFSFVDVEQQGERFTVTHEQVVKAIRRISWAPLRQTGTLVVTRRRCVDIGKRGADAVRFNSEMPSELLLVIADQVLQVAAFGQVMYR
jgi:hypothetical protein